MFLQAVKHHLIIFPRFLLINGIYLTTYSHTGAFPHNSYSIFIKKSCTLTIIVDNLQNESPSLQGRVFYEMNSAYC
jgi:hypothetical protein